MKKAIKGIEEIMTDVEENWIGNDGGLTMAASDLLAFGRSVITRIQANDTEWVWGLDPFGASTGAESNLVDIAQAWARRKMRRQIEDRIRKSDFQVVTKVGKILGIEIPQN